METRGYGSEGIALIECINPKYKKYKVRWNVLPYVNDEGEPEGVTYIETDFSHKPTIDEIKNVILSWMNKKIDEKIVSGFEWNGMSVWLSTENQFNYKAAYDLAVQTNGANLPIMFKFGSTENPQYYTFKQLDELTDLYFKAMEYINTQLAIGWFEKDSINWEPYMAALENVA